MSAHPAPRATRAIRAETAGSSGLALGPNQRGKAGGEVEASIPVMAMAHSAPHEGPAGEPILLDAGRSCHACADLGRAITRSQPLDRNSDREQRRRDTDCPLWRVLATAAWRRYVRAGDRRETLTLSLERVGRSYAWSGPHRA